ncbi:MAG: type I DNA topoisomerase [Planctomycetota bacterium]
MAKKAPASTGKSLVIVESPAKARTITKFLGSQYEVQASVGHIRDLPKGAREMPEKYKREDWAYLGVNVDEAFEPVYIVPADKKQQVTKLRKAVNGATALYLATDEDREGEAISWHLCEVLKPKVPVHRLVFHEITKEAIDAALANPRSIDDGLVRAQETRRILDRLYGYEVSPLLWRKVGPGLSAGRVQSVAVRLIVEREQARINFHSATYWDLVGTFDASSGSFQAALVSVDGRKIPSGRDFDPRTGQITDERLLHLDEQGARRLVDRLRNAPFQVTAVENKPYTIQPAAPFTTSTLQQEANRKLGFTARRTMQVAQSLYENGFITYMRTDSTNLAQVAVDAARELVSSEYGTQYLPNRPRAYQSKVKNAQEAHEAIRPAGHPFRLPDSLRGELDYDQFRLFDLIWKRTIASQMADARGHRITITLEGDGAVFQVSGKTIEFPGFLRAYVEGSDDPNAELADKEAILPSVELHQPLTCRELESKSHTTQPPARYSEASLTRALEEMGIGRPSTYASIIDTILAREYVFKRGNALVPTWVAFSVVRLLTKHLPKLVDYRFTAQMEEFLDEISRHEKQHVEYLEQFFFGNETPGLKGQVASKIKEVDARDISRFSLGKPPAGTQPDDEVFLRVGKYGPFLEQGERRAALPDGMTPDELTLEKALDLLDKGQEEDKPLGTCPETGKPVFIKRGRFGPYIQRGLPDDPDKRNASLLRGMEPSDVELETALKLLALPRTLGTHPESGDPVVAANGRYGPYVKCGSETRSLPTELSPLDVTLDEALALLAQPKKRGRGGGAAPEPLKVFEASPVTDQPIKLLAGRYGPYVTDGTTNASLPKSTAPEELTFDQAVQLLADRAAKGGSRRSTRKKTGAKKKTKKKTAKKKSAKKKTAKKKSAAKKKGQKKASKKKKTGKKTAENNPS